MPTVSAIEGVKITLFVLAVLGTMKLVATAYPNNSVSKALLLLY